MKQVCIETDSALIPKLLSMLNLFLKLPDKNGVRVQKKSAVLKIGGQPFTVTIDRGDKLNP